MSGGKEKNKHARKRLKVGGGTVGKTAVVEVKDRTTNQVVARVIPDTSADTRTGFVYATTQKGAQVYTDDAPAYRKLSGVLHESVRHSVKEYVNGIESFWSVLKRGYCDVYHPMSPWQLQRYVNEFTGRHNDRERDTLDQMERMALGIVGKRLTYQQLIRTKS